MSSGGFTGTRKRIAAFNPVVAGGGGHDIEDDPGPDVAQITDALKSVNIIAADSNTVPTDSATFNLTATFAESNATPTETTTLKFPTPPDFADSNATPTEARTIVIRSWSSGSTSNDANQASPGNVDGQNDGVFCTIKTNNALGDLTNPVTVNTGSMNFPGGTVTSALIRVWFKVPARTTSLDTITITATSSGGFSGTVYTHSGTAAVDHSTTATSLTFDISTLTNAQLTALVLHGNYNAAVVATPETSLQIDAWSIDATETI